jgi:murein DD-endopeptidase MepM/ murein hydrolase activator NlpD
MPILAQSPLRVLLLMNLFCFALLLDGCSNSPSRSVPRTHARTHVVKSGETLYSIAQRYHVDYHELARLNDIGSDYRITKGQVLRLNAARDTTSPDSAASPASTVRREPAVPKMPLPVLNWQWPVARGAFAIEDRPTGGQGMKITGELGASVRAAADGKVVYVGSGLRSYGQLIVVRHTEPFLSAYGYLQSMQVREGQEVRAGEQIATMGVDPAQHPALYFEIRINGRPMNPRVFLPQ